MQFKFASDYFLRAYTRVPGCVVQFSSVLYLDGIKVVFLKLFFAHIWLPSHQFFKGRLENTYTNPIPWFLFCFVLFPPPPPPFFFFQGGRKAQQCPLAAVSEGLVLSWSFLSWVPSESWPRTSQVALYTTEEVYGICLGVRIPSS